MLPTDVSSGDVGDALESIDMDPQAIRAILDMLDQGADEVHDTKLDDVPAGTYGASDNAPTLASDASMAHQVVAEAMTDMVAGLRGYRDNIATYKRNQFGTDDNTGAALNSLTSDSPILTGITNSANCLNTPTVATPSTCEMPVDGADYSEAGS